MKKVLLILLAIVVVAIAGSAKWTTYPSVRESSKEFYTLAGTVFKAGGTTIDTSLSLPFTKFATLSWSVEGISNPGGKFYLEAKIDTSSWIKVDSFVFATMNTVRTIANIYADSLRMRTTALADSNSHAYMIWKGR